MRAQQLVQDLYSLLGGKGAAGVSGVGEQKERKEQGSMEKRNEERRPMGKDRSGGGNEESTFSTANVTIVLVKEDRKEGRVGRNHPAPSCPAMWPVYQSCTEPAGAMDSHHPVPSSGPFQMLPHPPLLPCQSSLCSRDSLRPSVPWGMV